MAIALIKNPPEFAWVKNPMYFRFNCDANKVVVLQIFVEETLYSDAFYLLTEQDLHPDADGNSEADLQHVLQAVLKADAPPMGANTVLAKQAIKRYYIKFAEVEGFGVVEEPSYFQTAPRFVALGGVSDDVFSANITFPDNRKILSTKPIERYLYTHAAEWITLLPSSDGNLSLPIGITYTDGTSEILTIEAGTVRKYEAVTLNLGYPVRNYQQLQPSKTVRYIEVVYSGTAFKYFPKSIEFVRGVRNYYYQNSLSGWDSFTAVGGYTRENLATERVQSLHYETSQSSRFEGVRRSASVKPQGEHVVNCGYKWRGEIAAARDMLFTNYVFELVNNALIPIVLTNDNTPIFDDETQLYPLTLQYVYARNERVINPVVSNDGTEYLPLPTFTITTASVDLGTSNGIAYTVLNGGGGSYYEADRSPGHVGLMILPDFDGHIIHSILLNGNLVPDTGRHAHYLSLTAAVNTIQLTFA